LRILITGGLGYLGGRLAQHLGAMLRHELLLGTRRDPVAAPVTSAAARVVTMQWQDDNLQQLCAGVDTLVHLAAMNAADCASDPIAALQFNAVATAQLVRAAAAARVRRFVYLSTAHVYGAALSGVVTEDTCPVPLHPYASSHRAAEDVVRSAHYARNMEGVVVRLANAFGAPAAAEGDCFELVVNRLCRAGVREGHMVLQTSGEQRRDFIPISEACRAIEHLIELAPAHLRERVFNVGSGWTPTVREAADMLADRIETATGSRPTLATGSATDGIGAQPLQFSTQRLSSTGFAARSGAVIEELDGLIAYCRREQAPNQ
jgi:UDP-glucose 4-epimerase